VNENCNSSSSFSNNSNSSKHNSNNNKHQPSYLHRNDLNLPHDMLNTCNCSNNNSNNNNCYSNSSSNKRSSCCTFNKHRLRHC